MNLQWVSTDTRKDRALPLGLADSLGLECVILLESLILLQFTHPACSLDPETGVLCPRGSICSVKADEMNQFLPERTIA